MKLHPAGKIVTVPVEAIYTHRKFIAKLAAGAVLTTGLVAGTFVGYKLGPGKIVNYAHDWAISGNPGLINWVGGEIVNDTRAVYMSDVALASTQENMRMFSKKKLLMDLVPSEIAFFGKFSGDLGNPNISFVDFMFDAEVPTLLEAIDPAGNVLRANFSNRTDFDGNPVRSKIRITGDQIQKLMNISSNVLYSSELTPDGEAEAFEVIAKMFNMPPVSTDVRLPEVVEARRELFKWLRRSPHRRSPLDPSILQTAFMYHKNNFTESPGMFSLAYYTGYNDYSMEQVEEKLKKLRTPPITTTPIGENKYIRQTAHNTASFLFNIFLKYISVDDNGTPLQWHHPDTKDLIERRILRFIETNNFTNAIYMAHLKNENTTVSYDEWDPSLENATTSPLQNFVGSTDVITPMTVLMDNMFEGDKTAQEILESMPILVPESPIKQELQAVELKVGEVDKAVETLQLKLENITHEITMVSNTYVDVKIEEVKEEVSSVKSTVKDILKLNQESFTKLETHYVNISENLMCMQIEAAKNTTALLQVIHVFKQNISAMNETMSEWHNQSETRIATVEQKVVNINETLQSVATLNETVANLTKDGNETREMIQALNESTKAVAAAYDAKFSTMNDKVESIEDFVLDAIEAEDFKKTSAFVNWAGHMHVTVQEAPPQLFNFFLTEIVKMIDATAAYVGFETNFAAKIVRDPLDVVSYSLQGLGMNEILTLKEFQRLVQVDVAAVRVANMLGNLAKYVFPEEDVQANLGKVLRNTPIHTNAENEALFNEITEVIQLLGYEPTADVYDSFITEFALGKLPNIKRHHAELREKANRLLTHFETYLRSPRDKDKAFNMLFKDSNRTNKP